MNEILTLSTTAVPYFGAGSLTIEGFVYPITPSTTHASLEGLINGTYVAGGVSVNGSLVVFVIDAIGPLQNRRLYHCSCDTGTLAGLVASISVTESAAGLVGRNRIMRINMGAVTSGTFRYDISAYGLAGSGGNVPVGISVDDFNASFVTFLGSPQCIGLVATGTDGGPYIIEWSGKFGGANNSGDHLDGGFVVVNDDNTDAPGTMSVDLIQTGIDDILEVQVIALPTSPAADGGTWIVNGNSGDPLAWNASAADVLAALAIDAVATGTGPFTITWNTPGPQGLITADGSQLSKSITLSLVETQQGVAPVPGAAMRAGVITPFPRRSLV